jgi:hypothetical protein
MLGKPLAAIALSTAWAIGLAGCVIPEPIFEEPPAPVPDEGLVIEEASPPYSSVPAQAQGLSTDCFVDVSLPEVLDPSGAPVTARFFLNLNNANADQALTATPLPFEGSTDIALQAANEDQPTLQNLPLQVIDLNNYLAYLTQPTAASPQPNILEVFVSDGFSDDKTQLWAPSGTHSFDHTSWNIDLTGCTSPDL